MEEIIKYLTGDAEKPVLVNLFQGTDDDSDNIEDDTEGIKNLEPVSDDEEECTYGNYLKQTIFSCLTCTPPENIRAGVCTACRWFCHNGHEVVKLRTKRKFMCDCGNSKFPAECYLQPFKDENLQNSYNHNFEGLYCTCNRPCSDLAAEGQKEMITCCMCGDCFHEEHLGLQSEVPKDENGDLLYEEIVCQSCSKLPSFTWYPQIMKVIGSPLDSPVFLCKNWKEVLLAQKGVRFLLDEAPKRGEMVDVQSLELGNSLFTRGSLLQGRVEKMKQMRLGSILDGVHRSFRGKNHFDSLALVLWKKLAIYFDSTISIMSSHNRSYCPEYESAMEDYCRHKVGKNCEVLFIENVRFDQDISNIVSSSMPWYILKDFDEGASAYLRKHMPVFRRVLVVFGQDGKLCACRHLSEMKTLAHSDLGQNDVDDDLYRFIDKWCPVV